MKLIYSHDDAMKCGKGWYWQRYKDWKTSQLFKTDTEAFQAKHQNKLKWE